MSINQDTLYDLLRSDIENNLEKPSELRTILFAESSPGQAKSQLVAKVIRDLNKAEGFMNRVKSLFGAGKFQIIDVRLVNRESVDLLGLPAIVGDKVAWITPDFWPTDGAGLVFLDEFSQAPTLMQNACAQAIHNGMMGTYKFPAGYQFTLAGNRVSDKAGAFNVPMNIRGRVYTRTLEAELEPWVIWANENNIRPEIIGFLRFNPALFCDFDSQALASPNPRAWAYVNEVLNQQIPNPIAESEKVAGYIGDGAKVEFFGYRKVMASLPRLADIVADPEGATLPTETSALIQTATSVARYATAENASPLIRYLTRMTPEIGVFGVRDMIRACPVATDCREYQAWAADNSKFML
jgi:hypothetical protein